MSTTRTIDFTNRHFHAIIHLAFFAPRCRFVPNADVIIKMGYSGLGMVWYTVVRRGTNSEKGWGIFVEFKEFFSMMKKRISDGLDVPCFFRDLVAVITDVTEDEWDTPKDPSSKLTKENTLRTYAKRDISKKFLQRLSTNYRRRCLLILLNQDPRLSLLYLRIIMYWDCQLKPWTIWKVMGHGGIKQSEDEL